MNDKRQPCTCTGSCKGESGLAETWFCVLKKNMEDDNMSHGKLFREKADSCDHTRMAAYQHLSGSEMNDGATA